MGWGEGWGQGQGYASVACRMLTNAHATLSNESKPPFGLSSKYALVRVRVRVSVRLRLRLSPNPNPMP